MRTLLTAAIGLLFAAVLCPGLLHDPGPVQAGTALRLDTGGLVANAALIVEGRVLATHALETAGGIETEVLLEVERTFEGEDQPHRLVRFPGGVLPDGRAMLLAGMPRLRPGESVLLFLTGEGPSGIRMPVGLAQGKYTVLRRRDGTKALSRDTAGVSLLHPTTGRPTGSSARVVRGYAELVAEIEAALARKRAR